MTIDASNATDESNPKPKATVGQRVRSLLLSVILTFTCGLTSMLLWNWFVAPLGVMKVGIFHAMGLDVLFTFWATLTVPDKPVPVRPSQKTAGIGIALATLVAGYALHIGMTWGAR